MFRQLFKNKIFWIGLIIILFLVIVPVVVNAQFDINNGIVGNLANKECSVKGNCGFCDWIDLFLVLQKVILSLFGGLALVLLVWGGQGLITAAGNEEKIRKAKSLIGSTILGVIIILAGYLLVNIILAVLLTPPGQIKGGSFTDKLFGGSDNWVTAFCPDRSDPAYCSKQQEALGGNYVDGQVPCGPILDGSQVCQGGSCVPNCIYNAQKNPDLYVGCKAFCDAAEGETSVSAYCPTVGGTSQACCIKS